MVVDTNDKFCKAVIYPHAEGKVTFQTSSDRLTVTDDGKVTWKGVEITRDEADRYLQNMGVAFARAFSEARKYGGVD